jgi:hypothetical protein
MHGDIVDEKHMRQFAGGQRGFAPRHDLGNQFRSERVIVKEDQLVLRQWKIDNICLGNRYSAATLHRRRSGFAGSGQDGCSRPERPRWYQSRKSCRSDGYAARAHKRSGYPGWFQGIF